MEFSVLCLQTGQEETVDALNDIGAATKLDLDPAMTIVRPIGTGHLHIQIDTMILSQELEVGLQLLYKLMHEYNDFDTWLLTRFSDGSLVWFGDKISSLNSKIAFRFTILHNKDGCAYSSVPKEVQI